MRGGHNGGVPVVRWTMTSERECFVYIVLPGDTAFTTAGRFRVTTRDGVTLGEFVYGRRYRSHPEAVEFDPVELRLTDRSFETVRMDGYFGAIRDAMPDSWGRRLIDRRMAGHVAEEFDYLLKGPDDRIGALGFGATALPPTADWKGKSVVDLARLQASAERILADKADPGDAPAEDTQALLSLGTSVGGARPKTVVRDGDHLWIAKFPLSDDRWALPRVEHGLMVLAGVCGLDAAESRLVTVGDRDVLLVRRFDRHWNGSGFCRSRMASALTLLQADETVTDRRRWSYLLLADEIRRASGQPKADLRELFMRMCFNAAVSNLDDHPRNHAMVAHDRSWRLSPAYDLTPTPVIAQDRRDLAMVCGPFGRAASEANLIAGHGRFLLTEADASALFRQIVRTVRENWRIIMRSVGVSSDDSARIASAFLYGGLTRGRQDRTACFR